jgi:hypothetical protein
VDWAKDSRINLRQISYLWKAFSMMILSSAYWIMGNPYWLLEGIGSYNNPCLRAWFIMHCRRSAARTNNKGDMGSPCLTTLLHARLLPGTQFKRTEVDALLKIFEVQFSQFSLKPRCFIMRRIVECSMVSKSLVKSSLMVRISCLDCWQWWMYSKAHARQSWIVLVLMKPYWFWWTRGMITYCSLSLNSLVIILTMQLIREMGLKSLTPMGEFTFGTIVMKELLIAWMSSTPLKKSKHRWYMSSLIICQVF